MPCDGKNISCQKRRELLHQLKCLITTMERKKPCEWDEESCEPPKCQTVACVKPFSSRASTILKPECLPCNPICKLPCDPLCLRMICKPQCKQVLCTPPCKPMCPPPGSIVCPPYKMMCESGCSPSCRIVCPPTCKKPSCQVLYPIKCPPPCPPPCPPSCQVLCPPLCPPSCQVVCPPPCPPRCASVCLPPCPPPCQIVCPKPCPPPCPSSCQVVCPKPCKPPSKSRLCYTSSTPEPKIICCPTVKRCKSFELRSSLMHKCQCISRNGLQDRCLMSDCMGYPECMTKLFPICDPGQCALMKLCYMGGS